ncbi:hypothetical protein [Dyella silvae]|uniref:hypothetical protein n=1 Tax=Dyella silvae TaxID=2994424 RepID=UPI002264254D|nr:hypothetical protein [Dyella silvae]
MKQGACILFAASLWLGCGVATAACIDLRGKEIVPRHPSVPEEYASAQWVVIGRVAASRDVASQDDPGFYDWTVYDVEVVESLKGKPPHRIKLESENTSARFPMDNGRQYLLFVSHSNTAEMAGSEKLPQNYIDNCGNSGAVDEVEATVKKVRGLSGGR